MHPQEIAIFGRIGDDVTAAGLKAELQRLDPSLPIVVSLNSEGGDMMEGTAIFNLLATWPGEVTCIVTGWALSAAAVLLMGAKRRQIYASSLIMVHAPWCSTSGNAAQLRMTAQTLDQVSIAMRTALQRTGQPESVIASWLDGADHWFTADEALSVGLVDEVLPAGAAMQPANYQAVSSRIPSTIRERVFAMTGNTSNVAATAAIRAEAVRAEAQRRNEIRAKFDRFQGRAELDALRRQCEDDMHCTPQAAADRILAALGRDTQPAAAGYWPDAARSGDALGDFVAAARDVLLARAGIKVAEPHPAARDVQGLSIVAMAERVLSMRGRSTRDMSRSEIINAALSTSDFPSLLANVGGKALRAGYDAAPATHAAWTAEREVPDFKTQTLIALSEAPSLLEVPELGEYQHGALTESAETFVLSTWGRIVSISRQALVNDDMNALTNMPRAFGAAARRLEADKVYARLNDNPTLSDSVALFHASHGNLAGSGGAPSIATLGAARAAMRMQTGIDGLDYIDPQPRYLIVPVALETTCEQLLASLVDPTKSNDTPNVEWIRGLTLVSDPRLDASSTTAWYLAAAPQQMEGIVRAYLMGEQRPFFDENAEFDRDAISFKSRLDFVAGVVSYRALYKNAGA